MNDLFLTSFSRFKSSQAVDVEMAAASGPPPSTGGLNLDKFFEDVETVKEDLKEIDEVLRKLRDAHEESKTLHHAKAVKDLRSKMDRALFLALKKAQLLKVANLLLQFYLSISSMADKDSRLSAESNGHAHNNQSYTEIIIVRHGETEWNSLGKMQGHLDVDLNETGRQQAVAVADRLSREANISAIYSSDLNRAFETANIIASEIPELQVIKDQDLRERHLGDLQGRVLQAQELIRLCPEAYEALISRSLDKEIPGGGESLNQLYERCTSAVQRIADKHRGGRVIIVTHGGAIRSLYKRASPNGRPGKVLNTSISIIHIADGSIWSLKTWNDVSHLNQTRVLSSGFGGDATSG